MKVLLLTIISTIFYAQSLFAVNSNCATEAGEVAFRLALPQGNKPDSSLVASIEAPRLVKKSRTKLFYKVQINFDVIGGYSDSFPSEIYSVDAEGNEHNCRVVAIRLIR